MGIKFNPRVKLILSDVDETIADIYQDASPEIIKELSLLLDEGKIIFFITGGSLNRVSQNIVSKIEQHLHQRILIAHCSGAEVLGFNKDGSRQIFYSLYKKQFPTETQKQAWREIVAQLVDEFHFKTYDAMPIKQFQQIVGKDPLSVILDDRGPQITFELPNSYQLTPEQTRTLKTKIPNLANHQDLRAPLMERADQLIKKANLSIHSEYGGVFALDLKLKGVDKKLAIRFVLENEKLLQTLNLEKADIENPSAIEVWGDKFSVQKGGTDRLMVEAVLPGVRAIDFRPEEQDELPLGFNIISWDGKHTLHSGLLEYLQSRH